MDAATPTAAADRRDWRRAYLLIGISAAGALGSIALCFMGHAMWGLATFSATVLILLAILLT